MITFHSDDLSHWPLLRRLDGNILNQLDKFYIYGHGCNALLWTKQGQVFQFTKWFYSKKAILVQLPELQDVQVVQAEAFNKTAVFVLTSNGQLFGWGTNDFGNVGSGDLGEVERPKLVKTAIRVVRCTETFTVALDLDLVLWRWGEFLRHKRYCSPQRWSLRPVIDVQCLGGHILALAHTGAVIFYFDETYTKEIARLGGVASTYPIRLPPKITADALCLLNGYFLVLTVDGEVYHHDYPGEEGFGFNPIKSQYFQIPTDEPIKQIIAIKLDPSFPSYNKAILIGYSGKNYLYSCYKLHRDCYNCSWIVTSSQSSVSDLYSLHCELEETPGLTTVSSHALHSIPDFNDPLDQDTVTVACGEGNYKCRSVYAKRAVLQEIMKGHYLGQLKFGFSEFKFHSFYYPSMFHYMRFLHTDQLDTKNELIMHFFVLAYYNHNWSLMKRVVDSLSHHISQLFVNEPAQVGIFLRQCLIAIPLVGESLTCKYQEMLRVPDHSCSTAGLNQSLCSHIVRLIVLRGLQVLEFHSGYYDQALPISSRDVNFNMVFHSATELEQENVE